MPTYFGSTTTRIEYPQAACRIEVSLRKLQPQEPLAGDVRVHLAAFRCSAVAATAKSGLSRSQSLRKTVALPQAA